MRNKLILLTISFCLFSPLIRSVYSETASNHTADIKIISFKIEMQKDTYPYPGPIGSRVGPYGEMYRNNAYLCVDLINNSQTYQYENIPLKIIYSDNNGFKFAEAIVRTPSGEAMSLGEEKKLRILLDDSEYPYEQTGSFKYLVTVSPEHPTAGGWRSLKVGMTQEEIREILGEPTHIQDPASDSPEWIYGDYEGGGKVYFGTIGPLWNQKKLALKKWEEPI